MQLPSRRGLVATVTFAILIPFGPSLISSPAQAAPVQKRQEPLPRLGRSLESFQLKDHLGRDYSLESFKRNPVLVVVFLGTECPLARLYGPRLEELADQFADQSVQFLGVNSNSQDSISEIAQQVKEHGLSFPILKDLGNRLADQLGAVRTPEVFVLDSQRVVRYWGRIDDQYGIGYWRDAPKQTYVADAIRQVLAGEPVEVPRTEAVGCFIGRVRRAEPNAEVTYSNQIARILQKRCVECHREGEIGPFALDRYEEVVGWAETIAEVVEEERMPPWHASAKHGSFLNDRRLSDEEKSLIYRWVEAGAPEGDRSELPEPREYAEGWQLPKTPDLVLDMSDRPFQVPATGTVDYQYFRVKTNFENDRWIKAIEALPGNRAVVHHILIMVRTPDGRGRDTGGGARGFLACYVPGLRSVPFPEGMAKRLPAGSELIFQMHYTPIGKPQEDLSRLGIVFADPEEVKYEIQTVSAFQPNLRIPKGESDYETTSKTWLPQQGKLLAMMPHMHLRGKAFRYLYRNHTGADWEPLLDVPAYDFNWQTEYRLTQPLDLPAGAEIRCIARFDNSAENFNNPNPNQVVGWGEQTWDEMMIGYFDIAVPIDQSRAYERLSDQERLEFASKEFVMQLDRNDSNQIEADELPARMARLFPVLNKDGDEALQLDEVKRFLATRRRRN